MDAGAKFESAGGSMKQKKRITFAKKIVSAGADNERAEIARFGKIRTAIEKTTDRYKEDKAAFTKCPVDHPDRRYARHHAEMSASDLCSVFLDAVDSGNANDIHAIADAVASYPARKASCDQTRTAIISLKQILGKRGDAMPISKLAALLNRKLAGDDPVIPATEDSHAALRRLAKKLGFPIAKEPVGRPRKRQTRKPV
jgi:hypothetical protein